MVLSKVRDVVRRWLRLVDRMTPAELLDTVLAETAYGMEIRGPRRLQARENLKKLRGLIRRIQNRGYATLARIADHFERLAVGDESNAAIDAVDAVSLMTVHAAKGLEFPIVFVVNIGRGTGGVRAPIRITTSSDGAPAVAIADFQSEADEEAQAREREETKRLLYVALTRARDRLYLSATAENWDVPDRPRQPRRRAAQVARRPPRRSIRRHRGQPPNHLGAGRRTRAHVLSRGATIRLWSRACCRRVTWRPRRPTISSPFDSEVRGNGSPCAWHDAVKEAVQGRRDLLDRTLHAVDRRLHRPAEGARR